MSGDAWPVTAFTPIPCPGKHCGCMGRGTTTIHRRGREPEVRPPSHYIHPASGTVRVWMLAKFFGVPSATALWVLRQKVEGVYVKSSSSRIDMSDGDFGLLLTIMSLYLTPVLGLPATEYMVMTDGRLSHEQHLVGCFWLHRKLMRMEVGIF